MANQHPNDDPLSSTAHWHPQQPTQNQSTLFSASLSSGFSVNPYDEITSPDVRLSAYDQLLRDRSPRPFVASGPSFQPESYDTTSLSYYTRLREDELSYSATLDSSQRASTEEFSPSPSSTSLILESDSGPTDTISDAPSTDFSNTRPKKKPGRKKRFIELAPGQPPTSQGATRARVFLACRPCRQRKIRCDGDSPVCYSCKQRGDKCSYDPSPRRRGPDKVPGTRQRTLKNADSALGHLHPERQRRQKLAESTATLRGSPDTDNWNLTPTDTIVSTHTPMSTPSVDELSYTPEDASRRSGSTHHGLPSQYGSTAFDRHLIPMNAPVSHTFVPDVNNTSATYPAVSGTHVPMQEYCWTADGPQIIVRPSIRHTRKTWWDSA